MQLKHPFFSIKHKRRLILAIIAAIILATSITVYSLWTGTATLTNLGTVKTFGLTVKNADGTNLTRIDWGLVEPNSSYTFRCYLRNDGSTNVTLSMNTTNWVPNNASTYLTLTWNREGFALPPFGTTDADLTLAVSPQVNGVTDFSFDIILRATET